MAGKGNVKLVYFDGRARAEIIRLVMAYGKKPYEDKRIGFEDWPALKANTPLGSLPIMEIEGKTFTQGIALANYWARECGIYGANNMESLIIDTVCQAREDMMIAESKFLLEQDKEKRAATVRTTMETVYPKILGFFTKLIKENPAKSGYIVGKTPTLADIVVFEGTTTMAEQTPAALDNFPEIKALRTKVAGLSGIKEYLAKRKQTPF